MIGTSSGYLATAERCSVRVNNISSPRRRGNASRGPETQEAIAPMSYSQPYELLKFRRGHFDGEAR